MANRQTRVDADNGQDRLAITQHETDAPLIPVAQIAQLQQVAPDRVDWMFEQTEREADFRRAHITRESWMVFIERMFGQLVAAGVCLGALWVAYQLGMGGHEVVATAIGTTAVIGLAGAFLMHRRQ